MTTVSTAAAAGDRTVGGEQSRTVVKVVVGLLVVIAGARIPLIAELRVGPALGLAFAPVWVPLLRRFSGAVIFAWLIVACIAMGVWLSALAQADHSVSARQVQFWVTLLVTLVTTVGVILWARTHLSDGVVACLYGFGMVAGISPGNLASASAWKFTVGVPVTILLLGLAWALGRRWVELACLALLAALCALNDSRSQFAMLILAAALVLWQSLIRGSRRRGPTWRNVALLGTLGWAVYSFGQALLLEGYLGAEAQARTARQIEASGSVLVGGRPELGATIALMAHRPHGYGLGTVPTTEDILVVKSGMAALNYDPNNGYVENYMLGNFIELHSIAGDTWVLAGVAGLALTAFFAWAMVRALADGLSTRTLSALMAFLAARVLWDLAFGPLYSALPVLALAIGLGLAKLPPSARGST